MGQTKAEGICEFCGHPIEIGDWPFCGPNGHAPATARRRAELEPTVVYLGPNGEVGFPGSTDPNCRTAKDYEARGYNRTELPFYEARKFARQMNKAERVRAERYLEALHNSEQERHKREREELQAAMKHMSARGRDLARHAIERGNRMDAERYSVKDPGFHIEAVE
jgi:hypothetical protein